MIIINPNTITVHAFSPYKVLIVYPWNQELFWWLILTQYFYSYSYWKCSSLTQSSISFLCLRSVCQSAQCRKDQRLRQFSCGTSSRSRRSCFAGRALRTAPDFFFWHSVLLLAGLCEGFFLRTMTLSEELACFDWPWLYLLFWMTCCCYRHTCWMIVGDHIAPGIAAQRLQLLAMVLSHMEI